WRPSAVRPAGRACGVLFRRYSMSAQDNPRPPAPAADALNEGGLRAPPGLSPRGKLWWWFRFAILVKLARLRFLALLAAIGAAIVYWPTLVAHYEKWVRPKGGAHAASDVGYFCPMHPQVVTDNPSEKCPLCAMKVYRHTKASAAPPGARPPGVVTRHQLSPYKVVAAGLRPSEVGYEPLVKRIETVGTVEFDERKLYRVSARV